MGVVQAYQQLFSNWIPFYYQTMLVRVPAGDPDGVEFWAKGIAVTVGVSVELVVIFISRLDLFSSSFIRSGVQLVVYISSKNENDKISS